MNTTNFQEKYRPQFHFSPPANWMNDPNGMVYYEGEYHLFYQYYPEDTVWGAMHWGHAISKDLIHWEHLPIALFPDDLGCIFSGSAVVDWKNTSGLGVAISGQPAIPMIAIFTHHLTEGEIEGRTDFQYQSIAFSNDKGRTWEKYQGNPVIENVDQIKDFRDPKVIWIEEEEEWIMVFAAYDHVKFWSSKNLIDWEFRSDWGQEHGAHNGVWECPDLFPLKLEGTNTVKWALILSLNPGGINGGSGTQYFIGNFKNGTFTLDSMFSKSLEEEDAIWLDFGPDNYAGVTWSDIPASDGRRIFLGWMSNWLYAQKVPTDLWRSAMTIPRVLELKNTPLGSRLFSKPTKELEILRGHKMILPPNKQNLSFSLSDLMPNSQAKGLQLEVRIDLQFDPIKHDPRFHIELYNNHKESVLISFNAYENRFYIDRTKSRNEFEFSEKFASLNFSNRLSEDSKLSMHLFIDLASVELFADDGSTLMTAVFFPSKYFDQIKFHTEGDMKILFGEIYSLNNIWGNPK